MFAGQVSQRLREAGMLLSFALAGYFLLAMFSYDALDPSWSHSGSHGDVSNFGGTAGAWIADLLFYLFGFLAFLLPIMLIYNGMILVKTRDLSAEDQYQMLVIRWSGFVLTLISGCALSSMHFSVAPGTMPLDAGGILGQITGNYFSQGLGFVGATVMHLSLFLAGLTLFTGLSWLALVDNTGKYTLMLLDRLIDRYYLMRDKVEGNRNRNEREQVFQVRQQKQEQRKPLKIEPVVEQIEPSPRVEKEKQIPLFKTSGKGKGTIPPLALLDRPKPRVAGYSKSSLEAMSKQLELKLLDFGIEIQVESVHPGPVITRFEILPAPGVKVSQISNLAKDLARSLSVTGVRVVEIIPGKSVMGLEIPNENRELVALSEIVQSKAFDQAASPLTLALGKDISGEAVVADLTRMPHLLVAGTTGSGKSVAINAMLLSILFKATPEDVRMILIDPKMLELNIYEGIPHLIAPVVTDMKEAANALRWCVAEMERRYRLMASLGVRNISGYNRKIREAFAAGHPIKDPLFDRKQLLLNPDAEPEDLETLPYIVVVVDEFADMMMVVGKKVEELIARLAQKARASGIHLLLATQRPSVDVITGLIKSNIPTRIAFQVSSKIDSRTILDQMGAETLLGHGDMLYLPPGTSVPERVHGAFVDDHEVHAVINEIRKLGEPNYIENVLEESTAAVLPGEAPRDSNGDEADPLYDDAVAVVTETRKASISYVQRRLKIGYNRAARMIEEMEAAGVVSMVQSNGSREVLAPPPPPAD
ncbi:MAG: DNA translocase FtsK 4TM domain-containing protein [Gammaproteobacteria bacterium]|nr:DNA translocase FtsK 4TM domain-containing protein [Gammaproteobacteria bacterium]MDH3446817.1 DNA translocase FtsK 4TM domain-containing protein [Gammaproteobacteria bacterium]